MTGELQRVLPDVSSCSDHEWHWSSKIIASTSSTPTRAIDPRSRTNVRASPSSTIGASASHIRGLPLPELYDEIRERTPPAFRRRGVYIDPLELASV